MSRLHDALSVLRPKDFSEVPLDELNVFLRDVFAQAELIVNSVPQPPDGTDFRNASRSRSSSDPATKASEVTTSSVRGPTDPSLEELHKAWGKPLKINASSNPCNVSVWKMAGNDRHGAWFARRSVHEGLPFSKFKKAMEAEFAESLAVKGTPGEGSVRGIGADKRLERKVVEGIGRMEVYHLAAQFPKPTAPREFVTLLLTSDCCLTEASAVTTSSGQKTIPRHYMVVSIPTTHPHAPPREGLVLGKYESVEIIREIPLTLPKSASTTNLHKFRKDASPNRQRGNTIGFAESRGSSAKGERMDKHEEVHGEEEAETNPVEWIMVTRSDPGGGIPRFMVDRGTPSSITADVPKFLDWACGKDHFINEDEVANPDNTEEPDTADHRASAHPPANGRPFTPNRSLTASHEPLPNQAGVLSSLTSAVEGGIAAYAPTSVQETLAPYIHPNGEPGATTADDDDDYSTDTSSLDSFASAEQFRTPEDVPTDASASTSQQALASTTSLSATTSPAGSPSSAAAKRHDKELKKLDAKRAQLEAQLAKTRARDSQRASETSSKTEKEAKRHEDKYAKSLRKLEQKKEKEARKIEEKRRKALEKDKLHRVEGERDMYKRLSEQLRRENEVLKETVGELQRENTALVARLGKMPEGQSTLRLVREEVKGRRRGLSAGSKGSGRSVDSAKE